MNVTNSISFAMAKVKSHIRMAILKSQVAMAIFEESNKQEHGPGAVTGRNRCTRMAKRKNRRSLKTSRKRSVPVDWNTLSLCKNTTVSCVSTKRLQPVEQMVQSKGSMAVLTL